MAKHKKSGKQLVPVHKGQGILILPARLLDDLRTLIHQTREGVAQAVNSALVLLYWQVGHRIRTEILKQQRATHGDEVNPTLAAKLTAEFGNGFSRPNLFRMVRFAEVFPDGQIVSTLSRQLGWSHFLEIIQLHNDLQRDFYAEMYRVERWSARTLRPSGSVGAGPEGRHLSQRVQLRQSTLLV